jgi:hypothetical protein
LVLRVFRYGGGRSQHSKHFEGLHDVRPHDVR